TSRAAGLASFCIRSGAAEFPPHPPSAAPSLSGRREIFEDKKTNVEKTLAPPSRARVFDLFTLPKTLWTIF
ncbi:hypothetical protein KGQ29_03615, partial [Patescibacteria group bacterium]|nr:hypothetical protein [Patescibacteria group bacterium]